MAEEMVDDQSTVALQALAPSTTVPQALAQPSGATEAFLYLQPLPEDRAQLHPLTHWVYDGNDTVPLARRIPLGGQNTPWQLSDFEGLQITFDGQNSEAATVSLITELYALDPSPTGPWAFEYGVWERRTTFYGRLTGARKERLASLCDRQCRKQMERVVQLLEDLVPFDLVLARPAWAKWCYVWAARYTAAEHYGDLPLMRRPSARTLGTWTPEHANGSIDPNWLVCGKCQGHGRWYITNDNRRHNRVAATRPCDNCDCRGWVLRDTSAANY